MLKKKAKRPKLQQNQVSPPTIAESRGRVAATLPTTTLIDKKSKQRTKRPYESLDPVVAAAMRRDDKEIERLEKELGMNKKRLNREYATEEGFGDDFGDFLDDVDAMVERVTSSRSGGSIDQEYCPVLDPGSSPSSDEEDENSEESVPMKEPAPTRSDGSNDGDDDQSSQSSDSMEELNESDVEEPEEGEDDTVTYRPVPGEDIYGKLVDGATNDQDKPKKYVPPHLRNKISADNEKTMREIQRRINNSQNRLSEDTLVSVTQALVKVYDSYPAADVNSAMFRSLRSACVSGGQTMDGLIPIYVASIAGVHFCNTDTISLGEYIMEETVTSLIQEMERKSENVTNASDDDSGVGLRREIANLTLILCYMYNFGLVHCTLVYDIIRRCLSSFSEVDVEVILLVLRHSGRAMRADDPSSLKEIVLLVQKQQICNGEKGISLSRADFMVKTIVDLKNNKRRKQDEAVSERIARIRKMLGHIKSNGGRRTTEPLRISLDDVLSIDSKGRWWKVGASWAGNNPPNPNQRNGAQLGQPPKTNDGVDPKLLKLAEKYRMNTDTRRAIFCIIMGSEDYQDCFEKLVRGGMLKPRVERETVRVLMECCGNEKSYNKFYSHLAARLCEYQPQSKFSFQLSYWDSFKQFDDIKARKAANLGKLLFHLVAVHNSVKLSVIKPLSMATPEDLPEASMIFLTVFLSSILDHFDDPSQVKDLIVKGTAVAAKSPTAPLEDTESLNDGDALRASLTVFLVQVLKSSPKYTKGSKFRTNLKAALRTCDLDEIGGE